MNRRRPERTPSLIDALWASSREMTRSALEAYAHGNFRIFYLHGGMALEHAAKAVLARQHPALIADGRDFDTLLVLCRDPAPAPESIPRLRTVGLVEALRRASRLAHPLKPFTSQLESFAAHRNAAAHLGIVGGSTVGQDVVVFLRGQAVLIDHTDDVDVGPFYGEFIGFRNGRIAESVDATRGEVEARIAAAKGEFTRRFGKDRKPDLDLSMALHTGPVEEGLHWEPYECPACGTEAMLIGKVEVDYDVDYDHRTGEVEGARTHAELWATRFECRACGLTLSGTLLDVADIPATVDADHFDLDARAEYPYEAYGYDAGPDDWPDESPAEW